MLLPSMVYREIPREAHRELLRAQAILVRSRVCRSLKEPEALADLLRENVEYEQQVLMDESLLRRCREAGSDTQRQVLISGGTRAGRWGSVPGWPGETERPGMARRPQGRRNAGGWSVWTGRQMWRGRTICRTLSFQRRSRESCWESIWSTRLRGRYFSRFSRG